MRNSEKRKQEIENSYWKITKTKIVTDEYSNNILLIFVDWSENSEKQITKYIWHESLLVVVKE